VGVVKIGFLVPGPRHIQLDFAAVAAWAAEEGFGSVDPQPLTPDAGAIARRHGLVLGCTAAGPNLPGLEGEELAKGQARVREVLQWAAAEGVGAIRLPHRRDDRLDALANIRRFAELVGPLVEEAGKLGVDVVVENWPAGNKNIAVTPELWTALFEALPSPRFGLCMDPSHLVWLGIDEVAATAAFGKRIRYAHAKDTEFLAAGRQQYGIYGRQLGERAGGGWWRYRIPGFGAVRWPAFISALYEAGYYDGVLAIEHEDPIFYGSQERFLQGLRLGRRFLSQYVV
jgi:sugar phosphate isomerase/epimerase